MQGLSRSVLIKSIPAGRRLTSIKNILFPKLGAAGSSYARSVTPKTPVPNILPDPSTIFDGLTSLSISGEVLMWNANFHQPYLLEEVLQKNTLTGYQARFSTSQPSSFMVGLPFALLIKIHRLNV